MPLFRDIQAVWEGDYGMVVKSVDPGVVLRLKRCRECRGRLTYDEGE